MRLVTQARGPRAQSCATRASNTRSYGAAASVGARRWRCYDGSEQALRVYSNVCYRAGIQSHGARYAFAQERMQIYHDQGYSEREARAATSLDLGHGDGRGRCVASAYARGRGG